METLIQDVRLALRGLVKHPGHAAAVALTLALGIGANTAIFSVVNAVMLRPLPYPEAERLVDVLVLKPEMSPNRLGVTPAHFHAWKSQGSAFEHLGAYVPFGSLDLTGEGKPARLSRHLVSEGLLEALNARPARGRLFAPEDYRTGRAVLLTERLWRSRFGGDPEIPGRRLVLSGESYEVAGVLPEGFRLPGGAPDVVVPLVFAPDAATDRSAAYLGGLGRLRPGVTLEAARGEMAGIGARLARQFPDTNESVTESLLPLREVFVGPARKALGVIAGAVAFVLLIACANVASLQLARSVSREPEMVLRSALGAGARRLARQLLTESAVLSLLGGALGLLLAALLLRLFPDARGIYLPRDVELGLDARVLGFTFLLALACGLASSLPPALRAGRGDLYRVLGGRAAEGGERQVRLQGLLVVLEIALALVLLTGAGLMLRSFFRLQSEDLGFRPDGVLTLEISLPEAKYPEPGAVAAFHRELLERIAALPEVTAAGVARSLPPDDLWGFLPEFEGREPSRKDTAGWQVVTEGYFSALGTPVLQGRDFAAGDRVGGRLAAIASRSAARQFFPAGEALGRRVLFDGVWYEIVGIVEDQRSPGATEEARPAFYLPLAQLPVPAEYLRGMTLAVRTAGDPLKLAGPVRKAVWELDANLPIADLQTFEARLAAGTALARSRFNTALLASFAVLAVALALVGIYGVLSWQVNRRTRELGVRMALGALRADLLRLVLTRGLLLTGAGLAAGLLASVSLTRVLESLLFGVSALDPGTFALVVPALGATALLACYLPARRASRLDPLAALRDE